MFTRNTAVCLNIPLMLDGQVLKSPPPDKCPCYLFLHIKISKNTLQQNAPLFLDMTLQNPLWRYHGTVCCQIQTLW